MSRNFEGKMIGGHTPPDFIAVYNQFKQLGVGNVAKCEIPNLEKDTDQDQMRRFDANAH
jgi:hypothetical protein